MRASILILSLLIFYGIITGWGRNLVSASPGPDPVVKHAKGFSITHESGCTILRTSASRKDGSLSFSATQTIILVPEGVAAVEIPGAKTIRVPVERVGINFPTEMGMLRAIGELDHVVATCFPYGYPEIEQGIRTGKVNVTGTPGRYNLELLVQSRPDVVFAFCQSGVQKKYYDQAAKYGLPVVMVHPFMELSPLAKAEWMKFLACFFQQEEKAGLLFNKIESDYYELKRLVKNQINGMPTAFWATGSPKSWTANRNGFFSILMTDAGALNVLYQPDAPSQSKIADELLVALAAESDFWITDHPDQRQLAGNSAARFKASRENRLYDSQRQLPEMGFSEFFGMGDVHPEWVLADLISIFHPRLLPGHQLRFFKRQSPELKKKKR